MHNTEHDKDWVRTHAGGHGGEDPGALELLQQVGGVGRHERLGLGLDQVLHACTKGQREEMGQRGGGRLVEAPMLGRICVCVIVVRLVVMSVSALVWIRFCMHAATQRGGGERTGQGMHAPRARERTGQGGGGLEALLYTCACTWLG